MITCICGHAFSTIECPNDSMTVVREKDRDAHDYHAWRTYQLCDVERGGQLPEKGTPASEQFHKSLYAAMEMEGTLWECPACGRLLFRRPGEQGLRVFALEPQSGTIPDHGI